MSGKFINEIGICGKIPSSGDFLAQGLAAGFVDSWNEWLQAVMAVSREQLGRQWLESYEQLLDQILESLDSDKLPIAIQLASLPDIVRGYGPVKERFLAQAEKQRENLLKQWRGEHQALFRDATTQEPAERINVTQL